MRTRKGSGSGHPAKRPSAADAPNRPAADKSIDTERRTLQAIVDGSRDALWSWTPAGTIVRWNAEAERLFNYRADEIVGRSVLILVPAERHPRAVEIIKSAADGQWFGQYETVRLRKDGSSVEVELTVSPIVDRDGNVVECLTSCRDISERKQIEAALAQRMHDLTTLIRFTEHLQTSKTFGETYDAALDAIQSALACDRASVLLFDSAKVMRFVAHRGLSEDYRKAVDGHSPWNADSQDPEPICVGDAELSDLPDTLKATVKAEGIRALAFIPLITKGRLIGKFMTYYREPHQFSSEEIKLANTIAQQFAIAIDRLLAQEELRESEARFRLMSESAPVMIWMSDSAGKCMHLNAMLRSFWGVAEGEIATFDWQRTMHPQDAGEIGKRMYEALINRTSVTIKGRYLSTDGEFRVLQTDARPRFSTTGEFLGMIGVNVDITEQEQAQARIAADLSAMTQLRELGNLCTREGRDQARCLAAVVDTAIAITGAPRCSLQLVDSRTGTLTLAAQHGFQPAFIKFFGCVNENAPVTAAAAVRAKARIIAEDVTRSDIYEPATLAVLLDAGVRAVQSTPLVDSNGKVFGVLSTHFSERHRPEDRELRFIDLLAQQTADYLSRIQAEEALRRLQDRLEAEVESRTRERDRIWSVSEDLLGVLSFDGYFLSINPAWRKTLGWTDSEIKALHVNELRHPDDAAQSRAAREQLARGMPSVRMENRFRHKDGSWCWMAWTMTADDGVIYVAGRHVSAEKEAATALQRAQEQLANAQKMEALGQLTGGVAHDFNNIMMIVSGYAQSLKNRLQEPKNVRALDAIEAAISRGQNITRQLLSFSRQQPLNPAVLHPGEAVEAIRDVLSGSTTGKIELAVQMPEDCWSIRADKSEFALALINIALNARDAMPAGGRLSISCENRRLPSSDNPEDGASDFVALTIADTGCGIAADVLPKVFDPFFTTKDVNKGTGLGLSQVYGFARRSGGRVTVESKEHHGTTVTIYLPRSRDPLLSVPNETRTSPAARRSERILVVEDNNEVRAVVTSLLHQLGYRTEEADSAATALAKLQNGATIDLVLSDIVLPGSMDGVALAQEISARYPRMAVLLSTGYARRVDPALSYAVLSKPYDIVTLEQAIADAICGRKSAKKKARRSQAQVSGAPG